MARQLCYNKFYYKPSYDKLDNFLLDYSRVIGMVLHVIHEIEELAKGKKVFTIRYFTGKGQVFDIFGVQSWLAQKSQTTDLIFIELISIKCTELKNDFLLFINVFNVSLVL